MDNILDVQGLVLLKIKVLLFCQLLLVYLHLPINVEIDEVLLRWLKILGTNRIGLRHDILVGLASDTL